MDSLFAIILMIILGAFFIIEECRIQNLNRTLKEHDILIAQLVKVVTQTNGENLEP